MLRHRKSLYIILCLLIFIAGYISLHFAYNFILNNLESKIIPEIAKEIGIDNLSCKVSDAGLFGAEIISIHAGENILEAPSIDSVRIVYSPAGLYKKHIKKIVINGIQIQCEFKDGKFNIRGFDLESFISALSAKRRVSTESTKSFPIESIELRNSIVTAYWKNQNIAIPLNLKIVPHDKIRNLLECILNLYPRDTHIKISSEINLDTNKADIFFNTKNFFLERFYDFLSLIPNISASGSADIDGKVQMFFSPFKISSISCYTAIYNLSASFNNIHLTNSADELSGKKLPFYIDIRNEGDNKWDFLASSFSITSLLPLKISGTKCQIIKSDSFFKSSGNFEIRTEPSLSSNGSIFRIKSPLSIRTDYFLSLVKTGNWEFRASGTSAKERIASKPLVKFQQYDISSQNIKFDISGKGKGDNGHFKYLTSISDVAGLNKNLSFKTSGISVNGSADLVNKSTIKGAYNINLQHASLTAASAVTDIPSFSLSGMFHKNSGSALSCDNRLKFNDVKFIDPKQKIRVSGIGGNIPFKWPFSDSKYKGSVFAETILWNNLNLGSFTGNILQSGSGLTYYGNYKSIPFKGLLLDFYGKTDLIASNNFSTEIIFDIKKYKTSSEIDLGILFPKAKGILFSGEGELNGKLSFKEKTLTGFLKATVEKGIFNYKEKGILLEGIKINLNLPNLPSISSAPKQQFVFDKSSIGSVQLSDGKVDFQIESPESFFIENSRFKWCDGYVNTNALRISTLNKDLNLTLFCDRINLAKIIEQFGVAKAEGNGAVNGTIPIEYNNGKLIFADGFLYSTPGEGGTIHLADSKILSQNLIPGTSQFTQIELTLEALKNYMYDWAKLKFRSEGENLMLNLQFDGKPVNTLPFIYDRKAGSFVRVKKAGEGSNFQGISLDINFTIPLDKVLYYKDAINIDKSIKKSKSN